MDWAYKIYTYTNGDGEAKGYALKCEIEQEKDRRYLYERTQFKPRLKAEVGLAGSQSKNWNFPFLLKKLTD